MKSWESFEEERAGARKKALVLLTDMDRSESELSEKLKRAGFSDAAVRDALAYVKSFGYVDDDKYASHYVEVMQRKRSRRRIAYDLMKKGLSRDIIEKAVEDEGPLDERPLIRELMKKKMRKQDPSDAKVRAKTIAYLSRQGFKTEDILSVFDAYLDS